MHIKRFLLCLTLLSMFWLISGDLAKASPDKNLNGFDLGMEDNHLKRVVHPEDWIDREPNEEISSTLPMQPAFLVSDGYGYGFTPAMAYNSVRDEYLVVWGSPYNLYGRRISSRGELLGAQFDISINASSDSDPSVAYDPVNDRYLVVWSRNITPATSDPIDKGNSDVYGRFISWDGSAVASAFAIDSSTSDSSFSPKVVYAAATQEYLVVWEDYVQSLPHYSVRGRRIPAVGGGWPAKFLIASNPSQNRQHPAVAYNQVNNQYLVTFDNYNPSIYSTTNENIYGQRISGAGALLGGEFTIAGWPDDELAPSVIACPLSKFLVTWTSVQSGGNRVYARFVDFEGTPSTIVTQIESSTTGSPFVPAALACKEYQLMAVWEKYGGSSKVGISGRIAQFNETYEPIMEIAPAVYPHRENPAVACSSPNCLVTWEERNSAGYAEIYGRIIGETKPKAAFTLTPTSGTSGSTFFMVDASDSSDLEDSKVNLQVRWDWENDGIYDTAWTITKSAHHVYTIPCSAASVSRTIRLQVKDTYGLTDSTTKQITSIVNNAPTASFTVTPEVGPNTTAFFFDASGSSDVECLISELQVRWDWKNDATWDTAWSTTKTAAVTFGDVNYGFVTTKLEVKDGAGMTNSTTATIKIDNPPTAAFTVTPTIGTINTLFDFNPRFSTDPDYPNDPYLHLYGRWDWEDDGVWDTDWQKCWEEVNHQFSIPGTYTVRLEVRESEPSLRDSTTRQITVISNPPTALFEVTPTIGPNSTVFNFDASASSAAECPTENLQVRWDWKNDDTWDTAWSTTKTAAVTFSDVNYGFITTKLEVKDCHGLTNSTTATIKIDNPPIAAFTVTPTSGTANTIFQFDPSSSTDPDFPNQPFHHLFTRWDWEDDGIWDTDWQTCWEVINHQFSTPGTYTVRLEVRESEPSLRDSTTRQVLVEQDTTISFQIYIPLVLR